MSSHKLLSTFLWIQSTFEARTTLRGATRSDGSFDFILSTLSFCLASVWKCLHFMFIHLVFSLLILFSTHNRMHTWHIWEINYGLLKLPVCLTFPFSKSLLSFKQDLMTPVCVSFTPVIPNKGVIILLMGWRGKQNICLLNTVARITVGNVPGNHGYVETLFFFILQFPVSLGSVLNFKSWQCCAYPLFKFRYESISWLGKHHVLA